MGEGTWAETSVAAQVINSLVYTLTLQGHEVEVFMPPEYQHSGIEPLLRTYFSGLIHLYEELPVAAEGFDVVAYAEWYPHGRGEAVVAHRLQAAGCALRGAGPCVERCSSLAAG